MEEYINKIKRLSDQLKAKELELPQQVIVAWVLNNLTDEYEGLVSNITQGLRNAKEMINTDILFSNLLDEAKRLRSREPTQVLYTGSKYKGKKPYKIVKGRFYKHYKLPSHETKDCFFLFPDKAPKTWQIRQKAIEKAVEEEKKNPREEREEKENILFSKIASSSSSTEEIPQIQELDFDINQIMSLDDFSVYITLPITNNDNNLEKANKNTLDGLKNTLERIDSIRNSIQQVKVFHSKTPNMFIFNFILDTGATKHIISDLSFFYNLQSCDIKVN
jgi:hypothetical protein